MKLRTGNMWWAWDRTDLFLVATNSDIRYDGALIMKHGIAKEAAQRFPELPRSLGAAIERLSENDNGHDKYGILIPGIWSAHKVGAFQTKHECRDRAQLNLIWYSTNQLLEWCARYPETRVDLEFPGIDDLTPDQVLPIITRLPDTVTVWQKKEPTSFITTNAIWDNINAAIDKIPGHEDQDDFINELIDDLNHLYQSRHKHEPPIDF